MYIEMDEQGWNDWDEYYIDYIENMMQNLVKPRKYLMILTAVLLMHTGEGGI